MKPLKFPSMESNENQNEEFDNYDQEEFDDDNDAELETEEGDQEGEAWGPRLNFRMDEPSTDDLGLDEDEAFDALVDVWGDECQTNIDSAREILNTYGSEKDILLLEATNLGNSPEVIQAMHQVAVDRENFIKESRQGIKFKGMDGLQQKKIDEFTRERYKQARFQLEADLIKTHGPLDRLQLDETLRNYKTQISKEN